MKSLALRMVLCGALAGAIVGCGKAGDGEFDDSVPTKTTLPLVVPSSGAAPAAASSGNVTVRGGALRGDVAKDYVLTATVVGVVNTATAAVLTLVKAITDYPPTSVTGTRRSGAPGPTRSA